MGSIRRSKTKRRTRDLDQIKADLTNPSHLTRYQSTKAAEDLPGLGHFYCKECAKWFEGGYNLAAHRKGKNHKRRVKTLKEEAQTNMTAEAAVGLGVDNGRQGRKEHIENAEMAVD